MMWKFQRINKNVMLKEGRRRDRGREGRREKKARKEQRN